MLICPPPPYHQFVGQWRLSSEFIFHLIVYLWCFLSWPAGVVVSVVLYCERSVLTMLCQRIVLTMYNEVCTELCCANDYAVHVVPITMPCMLNMLCPSLLRQYSWCSGPCVCAIRLYRWCRGPCVCVPLGCTDGVVDCVCVPLGCTDGVVDCVCVTLGCTDGVVDRVCVCH